MNYNELYVLNSAIDGEDIYSIGKFSSNRMTRLATELIKDILIEKGYLEDYNTVTSKGASEIRKIKQYKEAKKYVSILNMVIGVVDNKKCILLIKDTRGEYQFSVIDSKKNVDVLIEAFPILLKQESANESLYSIDTYVNPRDLLKQYKINAQTSFTIYTENPKVLDKKTKELFFISDDKKYYYDCLTNFLHERDGTELVNILHKRLEVV